MSDVSTEAQLCNEVIETLRVIRDRYPEGLGAVVVCQAKGLVMSLDTNGVASITRDTPWGLRNQVRSVGVMGMVELLMVADMLPELARAARKQHLTPDPAAGAITQLRELRSKIEQGQETP